MCKESVQERKRECRSIVGYVWKQKECKNSFEYVNKQENVKIFFGYVSKTSIPYDVYNTIIDV